MFYLASRSCLLVAIIGTVMTLGILLRLSSYRSGFDAQATFRLLAWSYTPSAILVVLGYAIDGASSCTRALNPYMSLQRGSVSGQRSLLFNPADRSAFAMFSFPYWRNLDGAFFASSLVVIIYPVIKIMAVGLYIHSFSRHTFTANIDIDQSLIANLDKISRNTESRNGYSQVAYEYAVWMLAPEIQFCSPPGTKGSLIFSNLTSSPLLRDTSQALDRGGSLSANVPAIQVDVDCSAYNSEDFQVVREGEVVRVTCKSRSCRRYFSETKSPSSYGLPVNAHVWPGGFNISAMPAYRYLAWVSGFDQAFGDTEDYDLAPISGLFMNVDDYGPNSTSATQRFNITPKAIAGFSCVRSLNKVNVNVTFTRAVQQKLERTSILSTEIATFDDRSILPANDLPPPNVSMNYPTECVSSPNMTCGSSTSWITPHWEAWIGDYPERMPTGLGSNSFLEVLAATTLQYQPGNSSSWNRLYEPDHLLKAAKEAYTMFSTQVINVQRITATKISNSTVQRIATIDQQSFRAVQSRNVTIILIVLLGTTLACILVAFWRVPSKAVITEAPNSIAAQASLLAGSNLVRRLEVEGVKSVAETNIWNEEVFSMGWWATDEPQSGVEGPVERWGIDIGVARLRNTLEK